ncbi:MAG: glycosyltransferase family 39 protein [Gemmataceae bacterium]|nr:glycosyltransferase family 39 protein [Gemmataceae bacterium]MDW8264623.1 glycosyltransferase family 39 protein [Gemmataceae bacterium]
MRLSVFFHCCEDAPGQGGGRAWRAGLWVALLVGLALRTWHFARNPAVWHDEAALLINVIHKDFHALLGPLTFGEAAPPLFLWLERVVVLLLGDETWSVRLFPFVASLGSVILFAWLARRLLPPAAAVWGVGLFSVSDRLLWHACEAKPYALDVCAAVALASLFVGTRSWSWPRRLLPFLALAPVCVLLVYPGCFLCGGLLLALLPELWPPSRDRLVPYALLALLVFAAFVLLLIPAQAQRCSAMDDCWVRHFPPWDEPWRVPVWVVGATLDVIRYALMPTGWLLAGVVVVGGVLLWRRGEGAVVVLLVSPLALAFVASMARAYPFGGSRVLVFAAPALILLLAGGISPTWHWLRSRYRPAAWLLLVPLVWPAAMTAYRLAIPWDRADTDQAAAWILSQFQPGDAVLYNHWEYDYYFRRLVGCRGFLGECPVVAPRVWVVVTSLVPEDRQRLLEAAQVLGSATRRGEFRHTTAVLFERPVPGAGSTSDL